MQAAGRSSSRQVLAKRLAVVLPLPSSRGPRMDVVKDQDILHTYKLHV
eukprot:COSAG02_NODE_13701_length_1359_cov_2.315079_3_plen_47_part_01